MTKVTDANKHPGATGISAKSGKGKSKGPNGSFYAGGEELVKIDEANENEMESNASPTIGGTVKDINKRQGLEQIDEKSVKDKDDEGFRDSMQSLPCQEVR